MKFNTDGPEQWTAQVVSMSYDVLDRMERAVAKVRERLLRATAALNRSGVAYAVVGGNAVASWVASKDEGAVRTTRDVDLLVHRSNFDTIKSTLEQIGFVHGELLGVQMFRDGEQGKPSEAIHLVFSGERIRPDHIMAAPKIQTVDHLDNFPVLELESLVSMKLMSNRDKDRTHVRDLIGVGLVDASWLVKLPPPLDERLKLILDTPDG